MNTPSRDPERWRSEGGAIQSLEEHAGARHLQGVDREECTTRDAVAADPDGRDAVRSAAGDGGRPGAAGPGGGAGAVREAAVPRGGEAEGGRVLSEDSALQRINNLIQAQAANGGTPTGATLGMLGAYPELLGEERDDFIILRPCSSTT